MIRGIVEEMRERMDWWPDLTDEEMREMIGLALVITGEQHRSHMQRARQIAVAAAEGAKE